jgi:hypothetical protein
LRHRGRCVTMIQCSIINRAGGVNRTKLSRTDTGHARGHVPGAKNHMKSRAVMKRRINLNTGVEPAVPVTNIGPREIINYKR